MRRATFLVLCLAAAPAAAQQRDTVYFRDRSAKPEKAGEFVGAVVAESVNGVRVKPLVGPERDYAVADIVDVVYAPPRGVEIPFQAVLNGESAVRASTADRARVAQLVKDYAALQNALKDAKAPGLRRHIPYRVALLRVALAETREEKLEAAAELDKVRKDLGDGWQLLPLVRRQVQLLGELGKLDEAARVLEEAAKAPGLAKESKQELGLALIDVMIRAGKSTEAEARIAAALRALPADDPAAAKLRIYQVGARAGKAEPAALAAQLKALINGASDPAVKALAYNTLGDCYAAGGMNEEAKWAYLWVDVVYNQDRAEHAKAVERLAGVFQALGDEPRAEKYREKRKSLR